MQKFVALLRMIENAQIFNFEICEEDMVALDNCTEDSAYQSYRTAYLKCICRDTDLGDDVKNKDFIFFFAKFRELKNKDFIFLETLTAKKQGFYFFCKL